jgi:hypothetical protein
VGVHQEFDRIQRGRCHGNLEISIVVCLNELSQRFKIFFLPFGAPIRYSEAVKISAVFS